MNEMSGEVAHDQHDARHRFLCRTLTIAGDLVDRGVLRALAGIRDSYLSYEVADFSGVDSYGEGRAYHSTVNATVDFDCVRRVAQMIENGASSATAIVATAAFDRCRHLRQAAASRAAIDRTGDTGEREDLLRIAAVELAVKDLKRAERDDLIRDIAAALGMTDSDAWMRAEKLLDDPTTLVQLAIVAAPYKAVGAVERITDPAALDMVWNRNHDSWVRSAIEARRRELGAS